MLRTERKHFRQFRGRPKQSKLRPPRSRPKKEQARQKKCVIDSMCETSRWSALRRWKTTGFSVQTRREVSRTRPTLLSIAAVKSLQG